MLPENRECLATLPETPLLNVTMRQRAADRALEAIDRAVAIIGPSFELPTDEKGKADYETCEWLQWLGGRIRYAELQERKARTGGRG